MLFLACSGPADTVYTATLKNAFLQSETGTVLVFEMTSDRFDTGAELELQNLTDTLPTLDQSTIQSFLSHNSVPQRLKQGLFENFPVVLIPETMRKDLYGDRDNPWIELFDQYPDCIGLLAFSRPGISEDGAQALIYLEAPSTGNYALLSRESGRWVVIEWVRAWIS